MTMNLSQQPISFMTHVPEFLTSLHKFNEWFVVWSNLSALCPIIWCIYHGQIYMGLIMFIAGFISFIYHLADSHDIHKLIFFFGNVYDNYQFADFVLSQSLFGCVLLFLVLYDNHKISRAIELQIRATLQLTNLILTVIAIKKKRFGQQAIFKSLGFSAIVHPISWIAFQWFPLAQYDWISFGPGIFLVILAGFFQFKACSGPKASYCWKHAFWHVCAFLGIMFLLDMRSQQRSLIFFEIYSDPYNGHGQKVSESAPIFEP